MKKIFITGCTGYIGSHTCVELLNAGYEIVVLDNLSNSKVEVVDKIKKITGKDIAQTAMELVVEGNGGSEICDKVQADYQKLLDQSLQKEGSGRDVQN